MNLDWKSLVSLKVPVIIAFVVIWNAVFLYAMHLGSEDFPGRLTPENMWITGFLCIAVSIFSLFIAVLKPFQNIVVAESRAQNFRAKEFYFLALLTAFLGVSQFVFPLIGKTF